MALYKVTLAYDGTDFYGFQRQARARTVQNEFEKILKKLGWKDNSILAAGRTDAGVHASGQVITFSLDWKHSSESLRNAINAHLPFDTAAVHVDEVHIGFNPRYDALARKYIYRIYCQEVSNPLLARYAWQVWPAVDLQFMQKAAGLLIGEHDFALFGKPFKKNGTTIRKVISADWSRLKEGHYLFCIIANAFLYHMVRRLVFLMVRIGQGRILTRDFGEELKVKTRNILPGIAPACGLVLAQVMYEKT
jgi:tRNA pseudouridine38-40 synthase